MNGPKTRAYQVAVAVAFGLIAFGVNFLDIEFMKGATFKISILAGLFFPLVVALAWGWRYGLLSALAGGCQTMWWLWYGDGWGVLYSVPVFTLWIVWHGFWAGRRSEGHPWYISSFAVEIPFRIVIELGFLVVFRWLVSLNPPPWNPAVAWDHVSSAWLQTVAVKHAVGAYVLLMAAYVALSLGPVRRFFSLPPRTAQRDTTAIYAGAALFGLLLWALDALVDYVVFPREGQTFWSVAVHGAGANEVFMRSVYVATALLAGVVLARLNRRRVGLQELLDHRNRVLAAIRNVNQLVVREKDLDRLLDEACRLLVETRGYYNAWIVLTVDGRPREPFFHAGFYGDSTPMTERLRAGDLPICAQAALSSGGVEVVDDPSAQCADCPLSFVYSGRALLSLRLEHAGRVFGWMSLSCPAGFARSAEEHDLLKEVAGDIAFALWAIETEARGETLARKYAAVLAATSDAAVAGDPDGRITVFNPGAEKLFGCTAEEVLGSPITRFCPEDRLAEQAEMMRRVRDTGAVAGYESERLTAAGRRVPVEITLSLNTDDQGRTLGISAILRNISERKRAEEALRESEWFLRSTLDGLSAHIAVLDERGEIILTNKAYRDFGERNGVVPGAVSEGTNYLTACDTASGEHSQEAGPFAEGIREVLSGKRRYFELEYPCHSPDEKRWFVGRVTPIHGEGPRRVIVAHENITGRKEAEMQLRLQSLVLNQIQDRVTVTDLDGVITYVNDSEARTLGYSRDELMGVSVEKYGESPERGATQQEIVKETLEHGQWRGEVVNQTVDGREVILDCRTQVVFDEQGNRVALAGISTDITERKRAEESLRESETRFRFLVDHSYDLIWTLKADGVFSYVSPSWNTRLGHEPSSVVGRAFQPFVHPDDVAACEDYVSRVLEARSALPGPQYRVRHADGTWRWHEAGMTPTYAQDGSFIYFVGVSRDITERMGAELALSRSEALLNASQRIARIGGWEWHLPEQTMTWTDETYRIHDLEPGDIAEGSDAHIANSLQCYDEHGRPAVLAAFRKCVEQGSPYDMDVPFTTFKGRRLWIRTSAHAVMEDGKVRRVVGVIMDITERKRVEEALRESEERFRAANEASLDALLLLRSERDETGEVCDFVFVDVNRRTEEMLRMSRDRFLGERLCEVLPINREAGFFEKYKRVVDTGIPLEEEFFLPETHVPAAWYHQQVVKMHDGIFICQRDIGDRKLAEAERENLQAQLHQAQKMEAVGRLAGGVAHDFNNMLGIILGHADMLLEQMDPDQPFHADLTEIRTAGARSADLTRQLLAFARKQTVAPKVIDLNETVGGMLQMLHRLIGENIEMAWIPGGKVWPVKIDPGQIDQILANLCVNARDAIAGVGKVTIETGRAVFDEAYYKDHAGFVPGEYALLAVSDNGCGMDFETMSHLFEPFFTTKELGRGTGLGLATVYGVVKQNNGFVNVYSEPGQGTTFKIYLPRHRAKEAPLPDKRADRPAARGHETILLVEDEPAILKMATRMLEREGYTVVAAGTPGEAIRLANEHAGDIHLLMSDVVMPEMNGRELAKNILSLYPHLKCLFMSGYTADVIAHHGVLDEGVNFIQKPFSKGELTVKVREVLDRE